MLFYQAVWIFTKYYIRQAYNIIKLLFAIDPIATSIKIDGESTKEYDYIVNYFYICTNYHVLDELLFCLAPYVANPKNISFKYKNSSVIIDVNNATVQVNMMVENIDFDDISLFF
jgi:hypothetical protein